MASEPYGNLWGQYQEKKRQLELQGVEKALRKTAEQTLLQTLLMGGGRQPGPFERQLRKKEAERRKKGKKLAPPKKKRVPINPGKAFLH